MADSDARLRQARHDLSNPLSAILAEAQLLLLSADKYDEETLNGLRQIEALARRMRDLLQALDR
ncbi:MAG TPA: histidine kinase dimerization/phospho-acceptor domain-containing protein [Gemmatimonadales bacterium]